MHASTMQLMTDVEVNGHRGARHGKCQLAQDVLEAEGAEH